MALVHHDPTELSDTSPAFPGTPTDLTGDDFDVVDTPTRSRPAGIEIPAATAAIAPLGVGPDPSVLAARRADAWSASTWKAYRAATVSFAEFCRLRGYRPADLDGGVVEEWAYWLEELGAKPGTIVRQVSALRSACRVAGLADPGDENLKLATRAIRRRAAVAGVRTKQARAITPAEIGQAVAACPATVAGARDRAILLLGFAIAGRRSEISGLQLADITTHQRGLRVLIARSKTDQEGVGETIGVARSARPEVCPVAAWAAWRVELDQQGITSGAAFRRVDRHGVIGAGLAEGSMYRLLGGILQRGGVDLTGVSPHSLRAGFVTAAAEQGRTPIEIAGVSRHKSLDVLARYVRRQTPPTFDVLGAPTDETIAARSQPAKEG